MGIFSQCQIVLDLDATQVPFKKKQLLRKQITDNGGVISYILTKKSSYLVASNGSKTADSYKGRTAEKQGVPIVGVGFIESCLEEGRLLDHDDFLLVGQTASMQFSSGKVTTTKTQQEPKKQVKVSSFNINKFKVWPWGSVNAPSYPEDKYEIAKSVLLQKAETKSKERPFYQLELHIVPDDVFNQAKESTDIESEMEYAFRVFTHRGDLDGMINEYCGTREVRYCSTSEEAQELYSFLYHQQHNMTRSKRKVSRWIGSPRHQQAQLSISGGDDEDEMSQEVASLVSDLWKETLGELEDILAVDIKTLTAEKLAKAESILLQIRKALDAEDNDQWERVADLSQEFYSQIPHQAKHRKDIKTKSLIAKKQDLCQLIKDIVSVSETTNWSQRSSVESKYRALRCHISCLPHNHPNYYDVKNLIVSTQGEKPAKILRVFAVTRPLELTSFNSKLHNSRLLFHASRPANFVGILSRGLVLPKVVVDDFGGERTDAGMLGSGIYFADNFSTSAKYSHTSHSRGTRLMMVNQVALGEIYDTTSYQKDFTEPPKRFHSVHGVRNNGTNHSDFKDDEYVVYSTSQQRICYLVEFTLPGDQPQPMPLALSNKEDALDTAEDSEAEVSEEESSPIDLSDVQSIEDPLSKVKPGLLSNANEPIPLKAVHVRAKLLDLAAQVVVLQVYANDSDAPIEAKYVFPLDEQAAVCGFEAFINDKHIVGEVKEKETAHREYKEAISKGHGAYLMDEEKPDVFTVSVGNLPPKTTVVIKITYVAELSVDGDKILFALPGSVAPWRKDEALAQEIQTDVKTVKVNTDTERSLSVHVAMEMPYDIRSLESPTHPIKHKRTATKATVSLLDECSGLDDGFQLLIGLAEIHVPRMWVERHPEEKDSQACMLTFYPEFEADGTNQSEVVFLLDLSNSMRGGSILLEAKKVILLALHHLPKDWLFNIVVFGTEFEELFPQSKSKNPDTVRSAHSFLQGVSATMGNTDVWLPLRAYFMLKSGLLRNVFFISDGHVSNEDATLEAIRKNHHHTRVFTFGVSATANKYLLRAMSNAGAGAFEFFDNKTKSKWEGKVKSQLSKASQPVLSSVQVDWCQFDDDAPTPVQAPSHITSLFSGSRQVVYGYVPYCTQATLRAKINNKEVSTMVSTHELSITQGKILHQLTARNIIRDWEEGSLAADRTQHEAKKAEQKTYIIDLSKKYSIVTQFTSFVAVEVRDKLEEDKTKPGVDVADLLTKEEVDSLPYLDWQREKSRDKPELEGQESELTSLEDLLSQAAVEATFSVLRAERLYDKILEIIEESLPGDMEEILVRQTGKRLRDFYGNVKCDTDMVDRATRAVQAYLLSDDDSWFNYVRYASDEDAVHEEFDEELDDLYLETQGVAEYFAEGVGEGVSSSTEESEDESDSESESSEEDLNVYRMRKVEVSKSRSRSRSLSRASSGSDMDVEEAEGDEVYLEADVKKAESYSNEEDKEESKSPPAMFAGRSFALKATRTSSGPHLRRKAAEDSTEEAREERRQEMEEEGKRAVWDEAPMPLMRRKARAAFDSKEMEHSEEMKKVQPHLKQFKQHLMQQQQQQGQQQEEQAQQQQQQLMAMDDLFGEPMIERAAVDLEALKPLSSREQERKSFFAQSSSSVAEQMEKSLASRPTKKKSARDVDLRPSGERDRAGFAVATTAFGSTLAAQDVPPKAPKPVSMGRPFGAKWLSASSVEPQSDVVFGQAGGFGSGGGGFGFGQSADFSGIRAAAFQAPPLAQSMPFSMPLQAPMGLFPPPPPPPPPARGFGLGAAVPPPPGGALPEFGKSEVRMFGGSSAPPPPPARGFAFGAAATRPRGGLFGGPSAPPPPAEGLALGAAATRPDTFRGRKPPPPPPPAEGFTFGAVAARPEIATGGLFRAQPLPRKEGGVETAARVSQSEGFQLRSRGLPRPQPQAKGMVDEAPSGVSAPPRPLMSSLGSAAFGVPLPVPPQVPPVPLQEPQKSSISQFKESPFPAALAKGAPLPPPPPPRDEKSPPRLAQTPPHIFAQASPVPLPEYQKSSDILLADLSASEEKPPPPAPVHLPRATGLMVGLPPQPQEPAKALNIAGFLGASHPVSQSISSASREQEPQSESSKERSDKMERRVTLDAGEASVSDVRPNLLSEIRGKGLKKVAAEKKAENVMEDLAVKLDAFKIHEEIKPAAVRGGLLQRKMKKKVATLSIQNKSLQSAEDGDKQVDVYDQDQMRDWSLNREMKVRPTPRGYMADDSCEEPAGKEGEAVISDAIHSELISQRPEPGSGFESQMHKKSGVFYFPWSHHSSSGRAASHKDRGSQKMTATMPDFLSPDAKKMSSRLMRKGLHVAHEISDAISKPVALATRSLATAAYGDEERHPGAKTGFRIHKGRTNLPFILKLLKLQNEDGWWALHSPIELFIGLSYSAVKLMLEQAGVNSLGTEVATKIQRLVATYLVILHLKDFLDASPVPKISSSDREQILQCVLKAERWVSQVEAEHPSMAQRLELGPSWDKVCRDIYKKI